MADEPTAVAGAAAMRVVCGWCGVVMRESRITAIVTSTGMCAACALLFERSAMPENTPPLHVDPKKHTR